MTKCVAVHMCGRRSIGTAVSRKQSAGEAAEPHPCESGTSSRRSPRKESARTSSDAGACAQASRLDRSRDGAAVCVAPVSIRTSPEKGGPAASASLPHSRLHLQGAQARGARRLTRPQGCAEGEGETLEVGGGV